MLQPADIRQTVVAICRRLLGNGFTLDPFTYTIEVDLNASTTATGNFLVQNDAAFAILNTCQFVTSQADALIANFQPYGSGGGTTIGIPVIVSLTDTGSGRNLSDARVPLDSIFGTGQKPYYWPHPKLLDRASTFEASFQNLSATAMTIRLAFNGVKVFGDPKAYKDSL